MEKLRLRFDATSGNGRWRTSRNNKVRSGRFVPPADLLFYPVKRCQLRTEQKSPPSKGTRGPVDLLQRACDTRHIYHQLDQPVGAALL